MSLPPAGWYPDPSTPESSRWWDGTQWTEHAASTFTGRRLDDGTPLAGWWQRVGQYLIDSILVQLIALPVVVPVQIELQSRMHTLISELDQRASYGETLDFREFWNSYLDTIGPLLTISVLAGLAAFVAYGAICLRRSGRTVGMRALNIEVRSLTPHDGPLPWGVIFRRLLGQQGLSLLMLLPGLGFFIGAAVVSLWGWLDTLWATWDRRSQTLHDKIAGTVVVRRR